MLVSLATVFAFGLVWFCFLRARSLHHFIREAKISGLPYVVLPFSPFSAPWALAQPIIVPLLTWLPAKFIERRLPLLLFARGWYNGYEPFRRMGCDTFVAVSSAGNICYTCDPQLIQQLLRSNLVDKPADLMNILNIFGPTMTGSKNQESRLYRKITTPFFNESTMQDVWNRSLEGARVALKVLTKDKKSNIVRESRPTFARLSLYLLNAVCFENRGDPMAELQDCGQLASGHQMTYSQAMHAVLDYMPTIFLAPPLLLRISPYRAHKKARQAYLELRTYMEELRDNKKSDMESKSSKRGNTILDLVVQAGLPQTANSQPALSPAEVLGNIFIFMFAGHEANANTMSFILILLACHPSIQKRLQHDIDRIVGSSSPSSLQSWSYEAAYPLLADSMVGAVINETLRLFTVLPFIPKSIPDGASQAFHVADQTHQLPPGTLVLINTSALHRHPKYWPQTTREAFSRDAPNPVAAFDPESWFRSKSDDLKPLQGERRLRWPQEGSFVPFSDGSRGCLGKKFALVELCALLTRIFSEYTVELATNGVSEEQDDDTNGMTPWREARQWAEHQLSAGIEFKMSLRLAGTVPLKFVKRGEETFVGV